MTTEPAFEPLTFQALDTDEMKRRARAFYEELRGRRTVRDYAERDVPQDVIDDCLRAAGTAPSGANMQPWHFVVIRDAEVKSKIRKAAEAEERAFYRERAPQEWLDALAALGTDEKKPFLETAPVLIAIFGERYGVAEDGRTIKRYYVDESVGIATGMLIAALHRAGLTTLTHTPSPMGFLNEILSRPKNERPFLLLVVGYPAPDAQVPAITKKRLEDFVTLM